MALGLGAPEDEEDEVVCLVTVRFSETELAALRKLAPHISVNALLRTFALEHLVDHETKGI